MRIYYHLSEYISHRSCGLDYIECLRERGHTVFCSPEEASLADVAVIHEDPLCYPGIFEALPCLRSLRTIGYCVWENETLTEAFIEPLRLVREVWTPSSFSRQSLLPHCPVVHVAPHVVRRRPSSAQDMRFAASLLGDGDEYRFFSIVDSINPRKNLKGLLAAFAALRARTSRKTALVVKQYRVCVAMPDIPGLISIAENLTPGQMAALHKQCDAYVSAHHVEGWGLGMSEAMAYGKPVIATAYSGNMDYMDERNSLPVPYTLAPVSEEMCRRIPLFSRDMRWAEPDAAALVMAMKRAAEGRIPAELPERAAAVAARFSPEGVGAVLDTLLAAG